MEYMGLGIPVDSDVALQTAYGKKALFRYLLAK